jgi:hypothetical protein
MVHKKFMNKILSKEYTSRYNKKKKKPGHKAYNVHQF